MIEGVSKQRRLSLAAVPYQEIQYPWSASPPRGSGGVCQGGSYNRRIEYRHAGKLPVQPRPTRRFNATLCPKP